MIIACNLVCHKIYSENPSHKGRVYSDSVIDVCLYFSITFVTLLQTFILSLVVVAIIHICSVNITSIKSHMNKACPENLVKDQFFFPN